MTIDRRLPTWLQNVPADSQRVRPLYVRDRLALPLRILGCGLEHRLPGTGYRWPGRRRRPAAGMVQWTVAGRGLLVRGGRAAVVEAGDMLVLAYPDDHCYQTTTSDPWCFVWMAFDGQDMTRFWAEVMQQTGGIVRLPSSDSLVRDWLRLVGGLLDGAPAHPLRDGGWFAHWLHDVALRAANVLPSDAGVAVPRPPWFESLEALLEDERHLGIQVKELAVRLGLSRTHLSRQFMAMRGVALHDWLQRRRMECAMTWLADPGQSIEEIARRCGFRDLTHFYRAFKAASGMPPGQYQRTFGRSARQS
jgi:AraC-like DNA-binding protein